MHPRRQREKLKTLLLRVGQLAPILGRLRTT